MITNKAIAKTIIVIDNKISRSCSLTNRNKYFPIRAIAIIPKTISCHQIYKTVQAIVGIISYIIQYKSYILEINRT